MPNSSSPNLRSRLQRNLSELMIVQNRTRDKHQVLAVIIPRIDRPKSPLISSQRSIECLKRGQAQSQVPPAKTRAESYIPNRTPSNYPCPLASQLIPALSWSEFTLQKYRARTSPEFILYQSKPQYRTKSASAPVRTLLFAISSVRIIPTLPYPTLPYLTPMYIPDPVILHLSRRDPSLDQDQTRTIAWVVCIIIAAVLIIGIWCIFKLWGSRARNLQAEQDLGVRALPPPQPRMRRWGGRQQQQQEEFLPVYDPSGRPPVFSPPGMPPPAYLPGDAMGRETYRRDGIDRELGSIEEKDEPEEEVKKDESGDGERKERRASV
ncbi:unnamed protein product [Rhizoctonia solani]|uniref:Uncharacterized protein n=1 Tax=Rhizoctonia solani TaxID=456999 RepID=A0A8H3CQJ2_9AGAM|nr:unnamed protein product [Rhizoctonia solani]